jgi:hypothetical protein
MNPVQRIAGDEFRELAEPYLFSGLSKGIPSLFVDLKDLYRDQGKRQVIEELVEGYNKSYALESNASLSSSPSEPPTTYLWSLYFLSQHYLHLRQHSRALNLLDLAISHTPTLPELHACKARVLKRSGDIPGAARSLNDARLLDLQDRFLNTKCAKYRLRAGLSDEAQEIFGLFTKVGDMCTIFRMTHRFTERCVNTSLRLGGYAVLDVPNRRWGFA